MELIIRNILIGQNYDRVIKGIIGIGDTMSIEINAENGKAIITELPCSNHSCCIGKSIEISSIKVKLDDRTMYKTPMETYNLIRDGKKVEYISYFEKPKSSWNFEMFRDFCGMFAERTDNLGKLVYNLPKAMFTYAKENNLSYTDLQSNIVFDNIDDYTDHRTGINARLVMESFLSDGIKPTHQEIISWLDLIYIDLLPAGIELIAGRM